MGGRNHSSKEVITMKVKLYKFMGFYNKGSYIEGQFGNLKIRGYFKENWAGLYIIGKKETFQFLFFHKEGQYYKAEILDTMFILKQIEIEKNSFTWFLYTGPRGKREREVNGKRVSYPYSNYIFADDLE